MKIYYFDIWSFDEEHMRDVLLDSFSQEGYSPMDALDTAYESKSYSLEKAYAVCTSPRGLRIIIELK